MQIIGLTEIINHEIRVETSIDTERRKVIKKKQQNTHTSSIWAAVVEVQMKDVATHLKDV